MKLGSSANTINRTLQESATDTCTPRHRTPLHLPEGSARVAPKRSEAGGQVCARCKCCTEGSEF